MTAYNDQFLSRLATPERETQAASDVDAIATFPALWRDRLVVLRCYILICLDSQKGGLEDVYAVKLTAYRAEWSATLAQARAAVVEGVALDPAWPDLSAAPGRY